MGMLLFYKLKTKFRAKRREQLRERGENVEVLDIILCVIGVFLIVFSFLMNTKNVKSAIWFKVIPFFSGAYCIVYACISSGIIRIG